MTWQLPQEVRGLMEQLEAAGEAAYLVGGCVRDYLLQREPEDWDLATSALPQKTQQVFAGMPLVLDGLRHGTVGVVLGGRVYEITTLRREGPYEDHRRPSQVCFVREIEADLARRDYTINAMAWRGGALIDPFGGQADLERRLLRCVGEPRCRLEEDALRILRGLRFASQLCLEVDPAAREALHARRALLGGIAPERMQKELLGLLCGPGAEQVLLEYADVLAVLIPEVGDAVGFCQHTPYHIYDVWTHIVKSICACPPDPLLRTVMLFHDLGKPYCFTQEAATGRGHFYGHAAISEQIIRRSLRALRFRQDFIRKAALLVHYHDAPLEPQPRLIRRWLNRLGRQGLEALIQVHLADNSAKNPAHGEKKLASLRAYQEAVEEVLRQEDCFSLRDLAVNGRDLIAAGVPQGPQVGEILSRLLEEVMDERLPNEREALLQRVRQLR